MDEVNNMNGNITEVLEKMFPNLSHDDVAKIVRLVEQNDLESYKKFLKDIGVGCSVCKFNANLNPKGHCNGADYDELPFCKDYWVGDGDW